VARGIRIESGASISISLRNNSHGLPPGTVYTVLQNRSNQPIAGTFSNLPDGGTIFIDPVTLQADYNGGDGNDLTLTVPP
jgi:hypothetical protein